MSGGENWIQEVNRQQSEAKATIVFRPLPAHDAV
jgi:hypothetical protein